MSLKKLHNNRSGQILTSVIVFMAFGLSVVAMSAALTIINMQSTMKYSESAKALNYAEAGAEEGILRLIRDPGYAPNGTVDDLTIWEAGEVGTSIDVTVTGTGETRTITSTATYNGFRKRIVATVSLADDKVSLVSWREEII